MKISTRGRYALRMMLDIATNDHGEPVRIKDIAARQDISVKYLEQIVSVLTKAGYVKSIRGPQGGYRLARDPAEITLADVLSLTEGSLHAVACLEHAPNRCARCETCITLPAWEGLERTVQSYLSSVTLQSLLDGAKPQPEDAPGAPQCGC